MSDGNVPRRALRAGLLPCIVALLGALAPAQTRAVAITNARIVTMAGPTIEKGVVVLQHGKIAALGRDAEVPAGAEVVDAKGGTVMPGLVNAYSRAGLGRRGEAMVPGVQRGRGRGPQMPQMPTQPVSVQNNAATVAVQSVHARQEIFGQLLELGITTLSLTPQGTGFPGWGALLDPSAKTSGQLAEVERAFQLVAPQSNTAAKKLVKESFEKARRALDERRRPAQAVVGPPGPAGPPAPASQPAAPASAPASAPTSQPTSASQPASQPQKDPNVEALADLLEGKTFAMLEVDSATELLHYLDAAGETRFRAVIACARHSTSAGRLDEAVDKLKALKAPVILPAAMSTVPQTTVLVHPAKALHEAGVEVSFALGDTRDEAAGIWFRLVELIRYGLPAEVALRAVTLSPAKALGIDKRVGSLELGKEADVLLFDQDPLGPSARLLRVWRKGAPVKLEVAR